MTSLSRSYLPLGYEKMITYVTVYYGGDGKMGMLNIARGKDGFDAHVWKWPISDFICYFVIMFVIQMVEELRRKKVCNSQDVKVVHV